MGDVVEGGYNSNAEQDRIDVPVPPAANSSAGGTPPPGSGGGFSFDPDKLDAILQKWQDLQTGLKNDEADARLMAAVKAPGKEFASGDWEQKANPSGKAFLEQNAKMQDYVRSYIDALTAAKRKIVTQNAEAASDVDKIGNRLQ
jgi:hypothetical protein